MNLREIKKAKKRIETPPFNNLGIIGYGDNNLYPQEIRNVVASSVSGSSCLNRLISFISGGGFENVAFSEMEVNNLGETADDILQLIAQDLGTWGGFALHINYNLSYQVAEIYHIPFEFCRLGEEDDRGYISKIAVFPDWTGTQRRKNKVLRPTKEEIDYYDKYNTIPEVLDAQIESVGGIDNYKGQILWVSTAGKQEYPVALYDSAVTQMSIEEGLGNMSYRNIRNGFYPGKVIVVKRGLDTDNKDNEPNDPIATDPDRPKREEQRPTIENSIAEAITASQGDNNSSKVMMLTVDNEEQILSTIDLEGKNYDKDFTVSTETACENIYASFGMEVWHKIRKGNLGFSSDIARDAYDITSSITTSQRLSIERAFNKIFSNWHEPLPTTDFTIKPLKFISSEASDNSREY